MSICRAAKDLPPEAVKTLGTIGHGWFPAVRIGDGVYDASVAPMHWHNDDCPPVPVSQVLLRDYHLTDQREAA